MQKTSLFQKPVYYFVVMLYIVLSFSTLSMGDLFADFIFREDRYFEIVGALSFFATSFIFFRGFLHTLKLCPIDRYLRIKQFLFLGLALLFLFGGGEEISWGQRIFGLQTPDALAKINSQGEITVHNILIVGQHIPYETIFNAFWFFLTIILPGMSLVISPFGEFVGRFFPIVHPGIGFLFLFNYVWSKIAELQYEPVYVFYIVPFTQAVQEIKESNYAILFIFVAIYCFRNISEKALKAEVI
ncbi:MAG: hypothetical protein Q8L64_02955 [bacterium]|jgi:hypothetical protein|nr:hypothetical protein [bacterium]